MNKIWKFFFKPNTTDDGFDEKNKSFALFISIEGFFIP
jgi:hypothetical protein